MKELVSYLAKALVDHPESVDVSSVVEGDTEKLLLKVSEEDKGKIIGKQGKVIKALRSVILAAASKSKTKAVLDLE